MKLSVFTVATPELMPEELAAAAREAGLDGIEWRYKEIPADALQEAPSFWRHNLCSIDPATDEAGLARFRHAAEAHGLRSISVTPYLACGDIAGTERVMQAARALGASFIRVGVPWYDGSRSYGDLYKEAVAYLGEVQELARQYGVRGLVETHHQTITPSAGLAHRLVAAFDPALIGVLHDAGNMVHEGFEHYRMGLELLGPHLAHVHVKNAAWVQDGVRADGSPQWRAVWTPIREGVVDWPQLLGVLRDIGYDGYLGVEDFSGRLPAREMLRQYADSMREWLALA
ncbi:sugar phosphate isomerase/epimerase [Paenibacillus athensensis]|uniref:Xylose isomerase n=1 Tax=Paenibacillus athensensis TaxID=1967502 RepID=A0A4Y8PTH0_9BACL|nr:sugar phosphate isomerase/epimerase family protein [Paenibacillus athensensis]MCD1260562.1 sugar phosphate isomerase/epimerase [Paenibacillus athensensis]